MRLLGKDNTAPIKKLINAQRTRIGFNTAPIKEFINAQRTAFEYRQRGSHEGTYQSITCHMKVVAVRYKQHSTLDKVFQLNAQHNTLQH